MIVLLVDDHTLFRHGLKYLLADLDPAISFLEGHTVASALAHADRDDIDLILLDLHLPDVRDLDGLRAVKAAFADSTVVVLSSEENAALVRDCIEAGAAGFIPKSSTPAVLVSALRLVLSGGTYLPPQVLGMRGAEPAPAVTSSATTQAPRPREAHEPGARLTERQLQILLLAVQGKSNKMIARELKVSEGTVKQHLSALFRALGVNNRTEAVFVAAELGLSAPPGRG
ncbi:MAG TPA: response regulator transcription factor [Burkholderiaceae bacterium]|nr:response regulator transcription factor [Burkholderiaceae bacterium]